MGVVAANGYRAKLSTVCRAHYGDDLQAGPLGRLLGELVAVVEPGVTDA